MAGYLRKSLSSGSNWRQGGHTYFYAAIRMVAAEWLGKDVEDLDPEVR